jgi:hypothetical protein
MATKEIKIQTLIDKILPKTTNDLATRTHKEIGLELVFSKKVRLSFLLVTPVMVLVNNKSNM